MNSELILLCIYGLCGALLGSFVYACVLRVQRGEAIFRVAQGAYARSHCDFCKHVLGPIDLIPLFSFILLRSRCRYCKHSIQRGHMIAEVALAVIYILIGLSSFTLGQQIVLMVYAAALLFVFFYDLYFFQILDRVMIPLIFCALLCSLLVFDRGVLDLLLGMVSIGGFFAAQYFVSRGRWIGDGDIRLGVFMGAALGARSGLVALFLAYVIGAMFALILIMSKKAALGSRLPFGTFLSVATLCAALYGDRIWEWYSRLIHLSV